MTCEHRPSPSSDFVEAKYADESVQDARKHAAQNLASLDVSAQAQAQYFVEEFFEQLGQADFGFQAFLSWLQHKVQDSGRSFGNEELKKTQGVWQQVGLASESGEVQQDQMQTVIGLLLEKGMLVRGKSARWLQKENKALLQENARLRALLGLSGDEGLVSMVERLRDKLSLAKAELEDRSRLVQVLEAASHSEHQSQLENSCSEAQMSKNSHVHESALHEQMRMTLAEQYKGTCDSASLENSTVAALQDCMESASCANALDGTEGNIERAELREFPTGLAENTAFDIAVNTTDPRCDASTVSRDSVSENKQTFFCDAMRIGIEDCFDSATARDADKAQTLSHSPVLTCESGAIPVHLEFPDVAQKHQEHKELDRAHVGVQAFSETEYCPRDSSVQAGRSFGDQVDVAVQSAYIEKDIAIDFDVATWSPWSASQGVELVNDDRTFCSKSDSCHVPADVEYFDEDETLQKPEAGSQDGVLCTNCGELVGLTEDDAKVKRSVQEILFDLEREKNAEIERLRKLLAARTFELDKFEQSTSRRLQEGQNVRALVKMKWKKNGKQMAVTWVGSTFKVNIGTIGRVCSLDPLYVSWPTAKHGTFIGEVAPDQVELESSVAHEGFSSNTGPTNPQPQIVQGSVVCMQGLNEAHLLNGQKGTCEQWDAATGRWQVRLDIGKVIAVKPTNVRLAAFS